jgi:carbonic anhydrase
MEKLIRGIVEFREHLLPEYVEKFKALAHRQTPDSFFISCADSRVVPELLVSTDPGDLFVMRNVGNLVPPATVDGDSTGDLSEGGAIEFALNVLQVKSIVICGHSECGAMKAALAGKPIEGSPNLDGWLHHAQTALFRLEQEGPLDGRLAPHNQLSQLNVLEQMEHMSTYPIVRDRLRAGKLLLAGWWFDIGNGEMLTYEKSTRRFEPIDASSAERLIAQLNDKGPATA